MKFSKVNEIKSDKNNFARLIDVIRIAIQDH